MRAYFYAALAVAGALLLAAVFYFQKEATAARAELELARVDLSIAKAANAAQRKTIEQLQMESEINNRLVGKFANDIDAIRDGTEETNRALAGLKDEDPSVGDFMRIRVPQRVQDLLNR